MPNNGQDLAQKSKLYNENDPTMAEQSKKMGNLNTDQKIAKQNQSQNLYGATKIDIKGKYFKFLYQKLSLFC